MVLKCSPEKNIAYSEISNKLQDMNNYKFNFLYLYFQNILEYFLQRDETTNLLGSNASKGTETICAFRSNLLNDFG